MKKLSLILILSLCFVSTYVRAEEPGAGQTPPIISQEDPDIHTPPVLPDSTGDLTGIPATSNQTEDQEHSLPGMPGGGTQHTGAYNDDPGFDSTAGAGAPRSGAAELAKCNNIKFLSLIDILIWVKCIIVVAIIPMIFVLAFLVFLWGILRYMSATSAEKQKENKKFIVAGLIGLFVMTSVWGIVKIVGNTLGTGSAVPILQTSSLKKTP